MRENIIFPVYYNYNYYRIMNQKIKSTFNYRRLYFYYCHEYLNHLKVKLSLSLSPFHSLRLTQSGVIASFLKY